MGLQDTERYRVRFAVQSLNCVGLLVTPLNYSLHNVDWLRKPHQKKKKKKERKPHQGHVTFGEYQVSRKGKFPL